MANRPIKIKIDVTKISKEHLYRGAKGTYLDCAIWPNKSGGTDEYGNTHYIVQEVGKEAREQGEKGKIIGNMVMPLDQFTTAPERHSPPPARASTQEPTKHNPAEEEDDIPFN